MFLIYQSEIFSFDISFFSEVPFPSYRPVSAIDVSIQPNKNTSEELENECGKVTYVTGLIRGGTQTNATQYPWIAALYINGNYACTANFISRTKAVTAAHCLDDNLDLNDIELYIFSNRSK